MMTPRRPRLRAPLLARLLLRLRRLGERREEIESDLQELYAERAANRGRWYAVFRYWADAASLWMHRAARVTRPSIPDDRRAFMASHGGAIAAAGLGRGRVIRLLDGLLLDVRFALRMFRRQRGAVTVTVAGLALAIGATSVVFGFVSTAMMPPADGLGPDPSSVVELSRVSARGTFPTRRTEEDYLRLREAARLVKLETWVRENTRFGQAGSEEVLVALVSGGYFETLGAGATIGRVLTEFDNAAGAAPAAVISHTFWKQRYGGDESIVGQTVWLMGTSFSVVGVIEKGFVGPTAGGGPPAFWVPLAMHGRAWQRAPARELFLWIVGRIAEGATHEQAEAEVSALVAALDAERSGEASGDPRPVRLVAPYDGRSDPAFRWFLAAMIVVLGLILLLACTNVTNLLLAAAIARRREMGMRLALGASRWRVMRQLLTESLMLGALGGLLGLLSAYWLLPVLGRLLEVPDTIVVAIDLRTYGFIVAATLLAGIVAGLAPARYGARGNLAAPLKGVGTGRAGGRPGRTRSALVGLQAAASILLLVLAALLTRSMLHVARADVGFDVDRLLAVTPDFGAAGYDESRATAYWNLAIDRVSGLPGVERAALVKDVPFVGSVYGRRGTFELSGRLHSVFFNHSSADYFATAGIPVLRGRAYTAEEVRSAAPVAVITEEVARLWGDGEPLGATLEWTSGGLPAARVIGIVADTGIRGFDIEEALVYTPFEASTGALSGNLVVRARGDAATIVGPVIEAIRALDPQALPIVTTVRDGRREAGFPQRLLATTTATLGAIALGLAFIGVFGLTAFAVEQRTGEIGVRVAVGASSRDVVWLMLRENLRPVALGLAFGLLLALAAGRLLTAVLYGIGPHDPVAILAAVAALLAAAALAAAVPTRRASRVDPAVVLRA